ncbi:DNA primase [Bradyrhizobium sp. U87765 SZCCT0131]|uniref:DNA primase n=1 Tax=unclassified Bradyrhizobium TaxID=2631580 RepID=UPI001BA59E4D|nr:MULTISPECIES: DNA primase [unclassified Bradyrhizobium]MBR1218605.1 DNA primase [Bradyrhizobium sp. U87765 SZCCT0131]MBR1265636.1 DNA primase [Bradyrhizobium sp. U87765 SZCCT0134]MBR1304103.1 DNA primase [Bradyrhizobium sp. U87765 SZCCT0110]MBR1319709.1 DNA primase [Bradyrhizobium sp. U87765 SZCCT0109]MBR1348034.1 DNA primase [Bradyrhizobium sp. U87765 SZCCT0048]
MRFTPQFLEELRERLLVSEVVGRRVKLKKAGREWKGLSPFQQEKTPSFTVNDQKGFYHDFSSGKHGNIFDFVMETEGVSFPEAVERLASMAGLALPAATPDAVRHQQRRRTLHDIMEMATAYFVETLASRAGAKARGYLADRSISPATQVQFRLGYASPERFGLKEHLGKAGVSVDDMVEAGLLIGGSDIPVPFDRFKDRVMFPIGDQRGRIIAFGGRALEKDVPAKYLNSPETPLFHKGDNLYNFAPARQAVHNGAPLIVVEGYVDVIALVTVGFGGAVAPLGTALTENQLGHLWKMADEPILCFDGDKAGQRAAYRAADIALPHLKAGKSLRIALLPEGQDPDDLARAGGRSAVEDVIGAARPLADVLWAREIEGGNFSTPERRAALEARIGQLTNSIGDEVVRRYYRQDLVQRLQRTFAPEGRGGGYGRRPGGESGGRFTPRGPGGGGRRDGGGNRQQLSTGWALGRGTYQPASPQLAQSPLMRGQRTALSRREALILLSLINHPWLLHDHLEEVAALEMAHPEAHRLRAAIIAAFANDHHHTPDPTALGEKLRADLDRGGFSELIQKVERSITTGAVWGVQPGAANDDVLATWRQLIVLHRQWHSLLRELKDAELALGEVTNEANYAWLNDVKARLSEVDGTEALIEGFGEPSGRFQRST